MSLILPDWGGAMVHSDPQMTDFIDLSIPKENVDIVWHSNDLKSEKGGAKGNGIAGNGTIAACTFHRLRDNLVIYDYYGERLWTSGDMLNAVAVSSTPIVGWDKKKKNNSIIACDNKTILNIKSKKDDVWIEWISDIPNPESNILIPFSPNLMDKGNIVILPTKNGPVYAYDAESGDLLTMKKLGVNKNCNDRYYSTINSACVNESGDRVYISAESSKKVDPPRSRLYALDLNEDVKNNTDLFTESWFYPFQGKSQASPLFIDDTIYFDSYISPGFGILKEQKIYALTEKDVGYSICGTSYPRKTWFSFSKDPREGFWYEDSPGKKLVRFLKENNQIIFLEEINMKDLFDSPGKPNIHRPMSCMTICDEKEPIMLISALSLWPKQYLIAVKLEENNNSVQWKIPLDDFGWNYPGGQFTILKKNKDPDNNRILFGTYWDGVMAIGSA